MTTVTRMGTPRGPIPVTVSTFEAYLGGGGDRGDSIWGGGGGWGGWERRAQDRVIYIYIYTHICVARLPQP